MAPPRILIDTDFHRFADDHEALVMVAALCRRGDAELVGVTTVTGNAWAQHCTEHARAALTALDLAEVPIVQGASQPLLHRQSDFAHRSRLYGAAFGGAWGNSDLLEKNPLSQPPPSGVDERHAVDFIVATLRESAHPITLLAIGPLTNLALAIRIAPDIVRKVERLVIMGGAFFVPGNVTPSAEFNWWFDPEAAAIVLEQDLPMDIVPLDATDRIVLGAERYERWKQAYAAHPFFAAFHKPKFNRLLVEDPAYTLPVWDALAAACLIDESVITRSARLWVTVDCSEGASYGRVVSYDDAEPFNLDQPIRRAARVVLDVDAARYWQLYEDLVFNA